MTAGLKISIVTPSFNQGRFLPDTLHSVLDQGYGDLEYIVIDGGSRDGSADIIKAQAGSLSYWISEPDRGQSHALNKGFARATGDILAWINSDDYLEPGALAAVGRYFRDHPGCHWLVGRCRIVDESGAPAGMYEPKWEDRGKLLRFWESDGTLPQPASFWRRELFDGMMLREDLHFAMDYDLWLRFSRRTEPHILSEVLANFRLQPEAKTVQSEKKFLPEVLRVARPEWQGRGWRDRLKMELGWRRHYADRYFGEAFHHKQVGDRRHAWASLRRAIGCFPPCLGRWAVINLLGRLSAGR